MALWAALALANVCTMNHLVIIFYEVITQGIDIDSMSMLRANFTKGAISELCWLWFSPFPHHDFTMMKLTMIS